MLFPSYFSGWVFQPDCQLNEIDMGSARELTLLRSFLELFGLWVRETRTQPLLSPEDLTFCIFSFDLVSSFARHILPNMSHKPICASRMTRKFTSKLQLSPRPLFWADAFQNQATDPIRHSLPGRAFFTREL
jgi:hypothetical protein